MLYERRNVDVLLELLPRLVDPRGEVILADPGRPPAAAFLERAAGTWRLASLPIRRGPVLLHRLRLG